MSTDTAGSVTVMIRALREGDDSQATPLWERYFELMARLAHPIVRFGPLAARGTEEDAALSALNAFCDGIAHGRFPYVDSREVLWGTLATITERKAMQCVRRWKKEVSLEDHPSGSSSGGDTGRIMVVAPDRCGAARLGEFARRFPERWFDVTIAQQHAVTFAAGLAAAGLKPV